MERPSNIFEHVQKHQTCFIGFSYNKLMCLSNLSFKFLVSNILYMLYDMSGQLPRTIVILKWPTHWHLRTLTRTHPRLHTASAVKIDQNVYQANLWKHIWSWHFRQHTFISIYTLYCKECFRNWFLQSSMTNSTLTLFGCLRVWDS